MVFVGKWIDKDTTKNLLSDDKIVMMVKEKALTEEEEEEPHNNVENKAHCWGSMLLIA